MQLTKENHSKSMKDNKFVKPTEKVIHSVKINKEHDIRRMA